MAKVAWIGLGVMGYPMAGHIRKKGGHDLTVYNRNGAKAEAWAKEYGGKTAPTPADAAKDADFVFCCVGNDNDLREVTLGSKGAFNWSKRAPSSSTTPRPRPTSRASCTLPPRPRASTSSMRPCPAARPAPRTARSPS